MRLVWLLSLWNREGLSPTFSVGGSISIDTERLRSAVESGRTLTSIAAELGVSRSTVSRATNRAGIDVPKRPPPRTTGSRCPELNDPDWLSSNYATRPVANIAAGLGVTVSTVYDALRRHGITVRDPAAAQRRRRPAPLHDPDWLRTRYEHSTATVIADELCVKPQMVYAAKRDHGIERRDRSAKQRFRSPPELADGTWLRQRFGEVSGPAIADQLGVTLRTVYLARRDGVPEARAGAHRGLNRITPRPLDRRHQPAGRTLEPRGGTGVGISFDHEPSERTRKALDSRTPITNNEQCTSDRTFQVRNGTSTPRGSSARATPSTVILASAAQT